MKFAAHQVMDDMDKWSSQPIRLWLSVVVGGVGVDEKQYYLNSGFDARFYGVMVSTQDSESCDPSSSLGRTFNFQVNIQPVIKVLQV